MDFTIVENEHSARVNDNTLDRRLYPTLASKLFASVTAVFARLPPEFQRALVAHWGADGPRIEITDKLPPGWNAAGDVKHGRAIYFAVHSVSGLPGYILHGVVAEELLHLLQAAIGRKFGSRGEAERDVDRLMIECGFSPRIVWDFHASMTSTRRVSDEEWRGIQARTRYAMP